MVRRCLRVCGTFRGTRSRRLLWMGPGWACAVGRRGSPRPVGVATPVRRASWCAGSSSTPRSCGASSAYRTRRTRPRSLWRPIDAGTTISSPISTACTRWPSTMRRAGGRWPTAGTLRRTAGASLRCGTGIRARWRGAPCAASRISIISRRPWASSAGPCSPATTSCCRSPAGSTRAFSAPPRRPLPTRSRSPSAPRSIPTCAAPRRWPVPAACGTWSTGSKTTTSRATATGRSG